MPDFAFFIVGFMFLPTVRALCLIFTLANSMRCCFSAISTDRASIAPKLMVSILLATVAPEGVWNVSANLTLNESNFDTSWLCR